MRMTDSIATLKGIGPKTEQLFAKVGVYTIGDILHYFPRDYLRYPALSSVDEITDEGRYAVYAQVHRSPVYNATSRLQITMLDLGREQCTLRLLWFRSPYVRTILKPGGWYVFYGRVKKQSGSGRSGNRKQDLPLLMEQPEIFSYDQYEGLQKTPQPLYALTKGLSNKQIQKAIQLALSACKDDADPLPEEMIKRCRLMDHQRALMQIHRPDDEAACIAARNRLVFDEFFSFLLAMQLYRDKGEKLKNQFVFRSASSGEAADDWIHRLIAQLPFSLTNAQLRTLAQIREDMRAEGVMQRLIQGDVGSGKTIVAFLAMLDCAFSGYQSAIMAPTEVLARQHYGNLTGLCARFGLDYPVVLLTGALSAKERREAYAIIENAPNALIVGTHALIQEKVAYHGLALVITDEQHRFGVRQRESFFKKGAHPHVIVMSATPIPRTLAIILYGDLDISVIDEVPARRKPIKNCVVDTGFRDTAYRFMKEQIRLGHQAYVICPMVEESEVLEVENVIDYAKGLKAHFSDEVTIAHLHGRMRPEEKTAVMEAFLQKEIDILVSTTVVEVGVDVPNATVMLIENAERFGLAQLHQLRGRVGRGEAQSYCIFMQGTKGKNERLTVLGKSNDGFLIASEDLKLRGPGDFFGIRQSGELSFRLADIYQDAGVLSIAAAEVKRLLEDEQLRPQAEKMLSVLRGEHLENCEI